MIYIAYRKQCSQVEWNQKSLFYYKLQPPGPPVLVHLTVYTDECIQYHTYNRHTYNLLYFSVKHHYNKYSLCGIINDVSIVTIVTCSLIYHVAKTWPIISTPWQLPHTCTVLCFMVFNTNTHTPVLSHLIGAVSQLQVSALSTDVQWDSDQNSKQGTSRLFPHFLLIHSWLLINVRLGSLSYWKTPD